MKRLVLFLVLFLTVTGCKRGEPGRLQFTIFSRRIGVEMLRHQDGDQDDLLAQINKILKEREASLVMKEGDRVVWEKEILDEPLVWYGDEEEIIYLVKDGRSDWTYVVWE